MRTRLRDAVRESFAHRSRSVLSILDRRVRRFLSPPRIQVSPAKQGFPAFSCGRQDGGLHRRHVVIQLSAAGRMRAFAQPILTQDSLRRASLSVEKRSRRLPSQCKRGQRELFKKDMTQQLLTAKFSCQLRAICATPVQKGAGSTRLRRFLCCVCRVHR